jgi:hypothetical protein
MASFRLFAASELSLGTVLASADLGVLGNHPAVQNMLLAPRALGLGATLTTLYLAVREGGGGHSRIAAPARTHMS